MSDLREKRVELILQQLDELPTLPAVAIRVLQVTRDESANVADVVRLVESDPSLSTRILKLVHRADLGIRGEVSSVDRAVKLLGFEAVRSAVLAVTVFDTFRPATAGPGASKFSREEFWKHCVAVACCAELLARELGKVHGRDSSLAIDPGDAFLAGLLHDIGKVALDAALPKSFSRVVEASDLLRNNIADVERQVIGIDHTVVGKRLGEMWNLPMALREVAWLHGHVPSALPATVQHPRLVNLVTLADALVREQHIGWSGNYAFPLSRTSLLEAIDLSDEHATAALTGLVNEIEPRATALGLGQASAGELYVSALAQANAELGRVSEQLTAKNRKLSVRAAFFDALSRFQAELRPDAPPRVVLQAIGQTAANVLRVGAAAVFSLPPGRDYAEVALVDGNGELFESSIVESANADNFAENKDRQSDAPIASCGPDMEWLLEAVSPKLGGEQRCWIALNADGRCIGGIIWGAAAGEFQRLSPQINELHALAGGWSLALRMTQIREESRTLAEQLAEANRRLQSAQAEVLRSKTVLMVAEMAAGAAHEMNNPLMVISGRAKLLENALSDEKLKDSARKVFDNSQRLSAMITELMDFAKPAQPKPGEVPINTLIERSIAAAKLREEPADRQWDALVDSPEAIFANVDADQIAAALTEVLANAIQATPEKTGRVEVRAATDPTSQRVVISVSDNGSGMDEATLKHAFAPFYSSKSAGRRRGMGLAKAIRFIEANGGTMRLESRPNAGTRAIVLLPAAVAPAAKKAAEDRAAESA